jgi:hypothetical protein
VFAEFLVFFLPAKAIALFFRGVYGISPSARWPSCASWEKGGGHVAVFWLTRKILLGDIKKGSSLKSNPKKVEIVGGIST